MDLSQFWILTDSITTWYRSDPWASVSSRILTTIHLLLTPDVIRYPLSNIFTRSVRNYDVIQWKQRYENTILINIMIFCEWNTTNCAFLHEQTEFVCDRYDSFMCIVLFCDGSASRGFNTPPCRNGNIIESTSFSIQKSQRHDLGSFWRY